MAKYMVIFIDVDTGKVKKVFGADTSNFVGEVAETVKDKSKLGKIRNSSLNEVGAIPIFGAESSRKCRYIKVGGSWKRVCK